MEPVIHPDGQQKDGDGIHRRVERHVHACKLQPSGQSVGGNDGDHRQNEHVGGVPKAAEIEPKNDAQKHQRGACQNADFFSDGGVGVFGKLCKRKRPKGVVSGRSSKVILQGFGPEGEVGLNVPDDFVPVIHGLA